MTSLDNNTNDRRNVDRSNRDLHIDVTSYDQETIATQQPTSPSIRESINDNDDRLNSTAPHEPVPDRPLDQLNQRQSYQLNIHEPHSPTKPSKTRSRAPSANPSAEDQYTDITAAPITYETTSCSPQWCLKTFIPSLLSLHRPIRSLSGRLFDRIIRTTLSMLIASIISTYDWAVTAMLLPYLCIIIALMLSMHTVGGTIMACEMSIKAILFACVIDTIVLSAGAGTIQNESIRILVMMICIFFGALWLTYYFNNAVQRRLALVYHCATMIQAVELGDVLKSDLAYVPSQLLATSVLGCILIFLLYCLPFPRLAKDEVIDRWRASTRDISRIFNQAVNSFLLCDPIHSSIAVATAREELSSVSRSITEMRRLLVGARMEGSVFHLLFPMSISYGGVVDPSSSMAAVDKLDQQYWILSNLLDAIEKIDHSSDFHALMSRQMRAALRFLQDSQSRYLLLMSSQADDDLLIGRSIDQAKQRLKGAMQGVKTSFVNTRIMDYRQQSSFTPNKDTNPSNSNLQILLHDAISFQLGRWYVALESMKVDPLIDGQQPLSDRLSRLQWQQAWNTHTKDILSWSFFGLHPIDDAIFAVKQTLVFIRRPTIDWAVFKISLKLSLIISCASLVGIIPQIRNHGGPVHGLWAAVTASILTSDSEGMAWWRAVSRIYGTMFGGFIGYLILLTGMGWAGLIGLLMCWTIIMQLLQSFPRYLYLAQLGQITAAIVVFGKFLTPVGRQLTIEEFALERMTEICIGCCIYLLISTILWPVSSSRLLRSDLISSVQACDQATMSTVDMIKRIVEREALYAQPSPDKVSSPSVAHKSLVDNMNERDVVLEKEMLGRLLDSAGAVSGLLARQERCLFDAATEPRTLFIPVPETQYRVLMNNIRRCIQTIVILEPALREISKNQVVTDPSQNLPIVRISRFHKALQILVEHIHDLFMTCVEMLRTGQPIESRKAEEIGGVIQQLRINAAEAIKELGEAVRACEPDEMTLSIDMIPIATLLLVIIQLSRHTLTLELNVRRLIMFQRPKGYVD